MWHFVRSMIWYHIVVVHQGSTLHLRLRPLDMRHKRRKLGPHMLHGSRQCHISEPLGAHQAAVQGQGTLHWRTAYRPCARVASTLIRHCIFSIPTLHHSRVRSFPSDLLHLRRVVPKVCVCVLPQGLLSSQGRATIRHCVATVSVLATTIAFPQMCALSPGLMQFARRGQYPTLCMCSKVQAASDIVSSISPLRQGSCPTLCVRSKLQAVCSHMTLRVWPLRLSA